MKKWSKRSLDNLKGIHPDLRRVMDRALQDSPIDFTVIEGLRTKERQAQLFAEGKSRTMNSRHLTGHAVDLLPIGPNGKGAFDWALYRRLAPAVKAAAQAEGVALVWGGDWKGFPDGPHFELDRKVYPAGAAPVVGHPLASKPVDVSETPKSDTQAPKPAPQRPVAPPAAPTPAETPTGLWARLLAALVAWMGRGGRAGRS